jgi:hypothetical protein
VKVKKKNLTRLASLSALGAGALGVGAKNAHAGIIYTSFPTPKPTVGFSAASSFYVNPIASNLGFGGFRLFITATPGTHSTSLHFEFSVLAKVMLQGMTGMKFQEVAGPGFIWNKTVSSFSNKALRSLKFFYSTNYTMVKHTPATNGQSITTYQRVLKSSHSGTNVLQDRQGDFYLLFTFNPTGSQDLYGWLHLNGLPPDPCGCGPRLDTQLIDMAFDDSGALIQTGASPEPATAIPTGLGALALGATGLRRWRKSRKQAA